MTKKFNLIGLAVITASMMFGVVSAEAAEVSALTNNGQGYYESTERKVANYLQNNDVTATEEVNVTEEEIPFETAYVGSDTLYIGQEVTTQEGVNGKKKVTTTNKVVDGKVVDVVISEEIISQPVNEIVKIGTKEKVVEETKTTTQTTSTGLNYSRVITMNATAYCPCSQCCGQWANGVTASGMKAGYGVVAVDPSVIPLGTKLYVEGYGYCVAGDTGGAIKGNRIDLGYGSHSAALASGFGHTSTRVYILK
jgi:3D (Asp-Asp-Asp) domain-containing protein